MLKKDNFKFSVVELKNDFIIVIRRKKAKNNKTKKNKIPSIEVSLFKYTNRGVLIPILVQIFKLNNKKQAINYFIKKNNEKINRFLNIK